MKYLALIYGDEAAWEAMPEEARKRVRDGYRAFAAGAEEKVVGGGEAAPTRTATTVRVRDGQTLVSDGPAEDLDEPLGGFFVLECDSPDEAVELAKRIPGSQTGRVEVWPAYVGEDS